MATIKFTALALLATMASSAIAEETTYTLYRNTASNQNDRIHIATFDSDGGGKYNFEACLLAAALFQLHPRTETGFWCEKGKARR